MCPQVYAYLPLFRKFYQLNCQKPREENKNLNQVTVAALKPQIEKLQNVSQKKIPENIPLSASVANSEQGNTNWIWYVIILGILIVVYLFKKHY
jgi:hypothetical protein